MSAEAMAAFHRLRVDRRYRLDGTARLVLYYLCYRHNTRTDVAWPSTRQLATDVDIHRSAAIGAIRRLEDLGLIRSDRGGGRGKSTRYRIAFLGVHRVDPTSKQPIDWHYKRSGGSDPFAKRSDGPDRLGRETVRWNHQNGPVEPSKTVRPTGPENNRKNIKDNSGPPASAQERAGGLRPKTADEVFRERHAQRNLSLLSVASEQAERPAAEDEPRPATKAGAA